ncbi:hypothetical protein C8F04DRAFT_1234289 [Mycena alexandri]|uniref:Uncharacterized protein n=1 Tax=Mycena alexandri TaxID=1745969 RepID=A0AAD6SVG9_9AGAR|nr:hypothetical protein C8F04DRAFT_1234289 [Mycena alexandri]
MVHLSFVLVCIACMFHTWAAPLQRRTNCGKFNVAVATNTQSALLSLGGINTGIDFGNAQNLLEAQLSLLAANNGTTQIADSLLANAPPAPADANARIVAGLQGAQASLNKVFEFQNSTKVTVAAANSSITTALASAQEALASSVACQTAGN